MSDAFAPGTVHGGWRVVARREEGDGAAPSFEVASESGGGEGTLTFYPFAGDHGPRHRALAERAERGGRVAGEGLERISVGRVDGGLFVVVPEAERIDAERLAPERALDVVERLARGLTPYHRRGEAHGEVEPGSIALRDGEVTLFPPGLRLPPEELERQLGLHTDPRYAAPEVLDGREPTPASDVFSLALVLYRLVTGQHPGGDADPIEAFVSRARRPLPDLQRAGPDVSDNVVTLYERMGAAYEDRPADALALLEDVKSARKAPLPPPRREPTPIPRSGLGCAVAFLLLAAVALGGLVAYAQQRLPLTDPTAGYEVTLPPEGGG